MMRKLGGRFFFRGTVSGRVFSLFTTVSIAVAVLPARSAAPFQGGASPAPQITALPDQQEVTLAPGNPIDRTLTGVETQRDHLRLHKGPGGVVQRDRRGADVGVQM